jgi:hypothetical protein
VVVFVLWSWGTLVHDVKQRLPVNPSRAKIRNFFIKLLFGVEPVRAWQKLQAFKYSEATFSGWAPLLIVLRDARTGRLGLTLRFRIRGPGPSADFRLEHSVLGD